LVLFAIGLVLGPLSVARAIYTANLPFLSDSKNQAFLSSHPAAAALVFSEILMNTTFIVFLLFLNYQFFTRKRAFPISMIFYRIVHFGGLLVSHLLFQELFKSADLSRGSAAIGRSLIGAFIWIPYLLLSRRVKATFVR